MNDHYGTYPTVEPHAPGSVDECELCVEEREQMERETLDTEARRDET